MTAEELDLALINYLKVSEIVRSDLNWLLEIEDDSQQWSRAFLRSSIPLIEAYCQYLREMLAIAQRYGATLSEKNKKAVAEERACDAKERIKRNIRSAYDVFEITPKPDFRCTEWGYARKAIDKRGAVMHPKSAEDLELNPEQISQYRDGIVWVCGLLFNFIEGMLRKYGKT